MQNILNRRNTLVISMLTGYLLAFLCISNMAGAVSYPVSEEHSQLTEKSTVNAGGIVYLFHSGTPDVIKAYESNSTLTVYGKRHNEIKKVGKIKVLLSIGEYYLKAEVIEGEVRHDDIAKKDGASSLVILEGEILK
jgi:hypothetical protein